MNPERFYALLYLIGITVSSISTIIVFWIAIRDDRKYDAEERRKR
jgi:heme/copper-type cytochrome/quinol oxidase subunit 4